MSYKYESQIIEMMSDVRDRIIKIETKMESLPELHEDVKRHEIEIIKVSTQLRTMRWLAGFLFISIPASAAALLRIIKG